MGSELESAKIYRCPKKHALAEVRDRASFAAQTQSFLCGKFSAIRLEVLPNLRHGGVFQMSTVVNLGIGFEEPLTRPGVKPDKRR